MNQCHLADKNLFRYEETGRWSKKWSFLSPFRIRIVHVEVGRWSKKCKIVSTLSLNDTLCEICLWYLSYGHGAVTLKIMKFGFPRKIFLIKKQLDIGLKPFGALASIDLVVSVKKLLTHIKISIDSKTPNGLNLHEKWYLFRKIRLGQENNFHIWD